MRCPDCINYERCVDGDVRFDCKGSEEILLRIEELLADMAYATEESEEQWEIADSQ